MWSGLCCLGIHGDRFDWKGVVVTQDTYLGTYLGTIGEYPRWQRPVHFIHRLAILCLIPRIQEVVYLYMLNIVTCLILSVCRGKLAFKCHWILSKLMEIATSICLFLMSGTNFSLELSNYWAFSLVHAACKLQSAVVRITASLLYLLWIRPQKRSPVSGHRSASKSVRWRDFWGFSFVICFCCQAVKDIIHVYVVIERASLARIWTFMGPLWSHMSHVHCFNSCTLTGGQSKRTQSPAVCTVSVRMLDYNNHAGGVA